MSCLPSPESWTRQNSFLKWNWIYLFKSNPLLLILPIMSSWQILPYLLDYYQWIQNWIWRDLSPLFLCSSHFTVHSPLKMTLQWIQDLSLDLSLWSSNISNRCPWMGTMSLTLGPLELILDPLKSGILEAFLLWSQCTAEMVTVEGIIHRL